MFTDGRIKPNGCWTDEAERPMLPTIAQDEQGGGGNRRKAVSRSPLHPAGASPYRSANNMKIFSFLFLAALLAAGCSDRIDSRYDREFELNEVTFDTEAMQKIQTMSGFTIPENSRGLNFAYRPPMDPEFAAQIEIPPASKETVLKQIEGREGQAIKSSGGLPDRVSWWPRTPEIVLAERQIFKSDSKTSDNGYFHAILTRESDRFILYINYHAP